MKAIIFFLFLFPPLVATKLLAILLGLVVVPLAIPFGHTPVEIPSRFGKSERKVYKGWQYRALPSWAQWLWGSDKYGAYGNYFWPDIHPNPKSWYAQFMWLAVRNPANNLNNFSLFKPVIRIGDIDWIGDTEVSDTKGKAGFQLVTAEWLAGLYWILPYGNGRSLKVRLGFEISPTTNGAVSLSVVIHPYAKFGKEAKNGG